MVEEVGVSASVMCLLVKGIICMRRKYILRHEQIGMGYGGRTVCEPLGDEKEYECRDEKNYKDSVWK